MSAHGANGAEEKGKRLLQKFEFRLKIEIRLNILINLKP